MPRLAEAWQRRRPHGGESRAGELKGGSCGPRDVVEPSGARHGSPVWEIAGQFFEVRVGVFRGESDPKVRERELGKR